MSYNKEEDIILSLRNQNKKLWENLEPENFRVKELFRRKARNELQCSVVLQVSPHVHLRLLTAGKVHVDMQLLEVHDHSPIRQCSKRLGFGHGRKHCTEQTDLCSHCGGLHLRSQCGDYRNRVAPRCRNCCLHKKTTNNTHNAFNEECPVWQRWDRIARSTVHYMC